MFRNNELVSGKNHQRNQPAKVKLKFCRENLPILVILKDFETILEAMMPLIKNNAFSFNKTKLSSSILELDDYTQAASEAIIEAVLSCNVQPVNGKYDYEEYWSKFLNLCRIKIQSKLIEMQKRNYIPFFVSQNIARLHPKVHEMSKTQKVTINSVMKEFKVSKNIAKELIDLTRAEFQPLMIVNNDGEENENDIAEPNSVASNIFVEEMLSKISAPERELIEFVVLDKKPLTVYSREKDMTYSKAAKLYRDTLKKLRKIYNDGQTCKR